MTGNEPIIYDWNVNGHRESPTMPQVEFFDETLRDGIQCPSVIDPSIEQKLQILDLLGPPLDLA